MPKAETHPTPYQHSNPLLDMETPLRRLRGLIRLLVHLGTSDHEIEQDDLDALSAAMRASYTDLCDAWERACEQSGIQGAQL